MTRTVRDLADAGILPRNLLDRAAVEHALGSVAATISLCTEGSLRDHARRDVGLTARLIRRTIEARRLGRELREIHPSSPDLLPLLRRSTTLINETGRELTAHCALLREVQSPLVLGVLKSIDHAAASEAAAILRANGIECTLFTIRQYYEAVGIDPEG